MTEIVMGRGNGKGFRCAEALAKYEIVKRGREMTDDELAEEYIDEHAPCFREYPKAPRGALKQSFLAGLEKGRPKWHDLRENPNDLPPLEKGARFMSIDVLTDRGETAYYYYEDCWYDTYNNEIDQPLAWCEIPKYTTTDSSH